MISESLKKYFDPIIDLELQVWKNFTALGVVGEFSKDTILKASNTTEKYFNFILNGSGGNLLWNENNFVCTDISLQNEPLSDYVSFMLQKPSLIEVRLFEDSKLLRVKHQNFQAIFNQGAYGEQVSRLAVESAYSEKQQQQIDLLTKTAKERYLELLNKNDKIDKIQLKYLASYLGITPQSLSRIRSERI